jgi:RNA polymerase sigma factor (sigma-70 family)
VQDPAKFGGYVSRVAEYVYLETRRKQGPVDPGPVPEVPDGQPGLDRVLIDSERKQKVRSLLEELKDRDRQVLRMLFYEEIEPDEVCRRLKVRPEHLKLLVHRARKRFQAKFGCGELEKW